jgi:hypothetical protein
MPTATSFATAALLQAAARSSLSIVVITEALMKLLQRWMRLEIQLSAKVI